MSWLVVITGPSHVGKTAAAASLVTQLAAEHVAIDEIIDELGLPERDRWEVGLRLAYPLARQRVRELLEDGRMVVFDSTFTYVPLDGGEPEFHSEELRALHEVARQARAPFGLVRLTAPVSELIRRNERTRRIDPRVVKGTSVLHADERGGPAPLARIPTDGQSPERVASEIREALAEAETHALTT